MTNVHNDNPLLENYRFFYISVFHFFVAAIAY